MALFKNREIEVGNIPAGSIRQIIWEFDEIKKSDIATYFENGKWEYAIVKNCSCQGEVLISEKTLNLQYKDKGFKGRVTKEIKVYLTNGDMPIRVTNERGIIDFNQNLGHIMLTFTADIV